MTFSLNATRAAGEAKRYRWFMIKNMTYFSKNPTSGLLSMLRSDWLIYQAICYSPLVAKSAGFENQNNGG